jgi:hypothetical protein
MSVWRQKAIDCAPELKKEFQEPDLTPYTVFMELLPVTVQAHMDNDEQKLRKIYDFAEWCHRQEDGNLWNAVGVSFYEHLADDEPTWLAFTNWIKKDIYFDVRDLLLERLADDKMKKLDDFYGWKSSAGKDKRKQ